MEHQSPALRPVHVPRGHEAYSPLTKLVAIFALLACSTGQGLSSALLGAQAGIERWISAFEVLAAVSSQLYVVTGVALAIGAIGVSIRSQQLPRSYRLTILPAAAAALLACAVSSQRPLPSPLLLALGLILSYVALFGAVLSAESTLTRRAAILLGLSALSTLSRAVVWLAPTLGALETTGFSTLVVWVGYACFAGIVMVALEALNPRRGPWHAVLFTGCIVLAIVAAGAAESARRAPTGFFPVVLDRLLDNLESHALPFNEGLFSRVLVALILPVSFALLLLPSTQEPLAPLLSLALLSRGALDIPALGLGAAIAALALPLIASGSDPLWISKVDRYQGTH